MQRRPLQTTQRKPEKSQSQAVRQTYSGNKNLKLTNKPENLKTLRDSKQKKDNALKIYQSPPKSKKQQQIQQISSPRQNKKPSRQSVQVKQKGRKKIISYTSQSSDQKMQKQLKNSTIQIDIPTLDEPIDDDMNLQLISQYPIKNNQDFLRETYLPTGKTLKESIKEDIKKLQRLKQVQKEIIRKTSYKKHKNLQAKHSRSKTTSEKKFLLGSNRKQTLSKSNKKLQKSNLGLKVSVRPIQNSIKGALSKTKKVKNNKSSSTETNKKNSVKKVNKLTDLRQNISPVSKEIPKSIPKKSKSKKKPSLQRKFFHAQNPVKQEQSQSETTKTPTLQQLQRLRQQNEKYKLFLAKSAFKVEDLKKQIEEHKQIRQNERGIYNFQLNNLKKQLDANKKYLGHLFSYEDPKTKLGFVPDQIIVETDNQSSSVLDSINVFSKVSKRLAHDELHSQEMSNIIEKSGQSVINIKESIRSSENQNQEDYKVPKIDPNTCAKQVNEDLKNEEFQVKYLCEIEKIPSLKINLSLEESESSKNSQSD